MTSKIRISEKINLDEESSPDREISHENSELDEEKTSSSPRF